MGAGQVGIAIDNGIVWSDRPILTPGPREYHRPGGTGGPFNTLLYMPTEMLPGEPSVPPVIASRQGRGPLPRLPG